jgi:hypothetical protein
MPIWLIVLIICIVGGIGIAYLKRRRDRVEPWQRDPITRGMKILAEVPAKISNGVSFHYEPGAGQIDEAAAAAGIADCFERLACHYDNVNRAQHDIHVLVVAGELSPETHTPCFRVPISPPNPYLNSEFDMMKGVESMPHYILAAGQMIAAGVPYGDVIMIPSNNDPVFTRRICDYESEHYGLAWYDGPLYEDTKIHGQGKGHPIVDPCPGAIAHGFASNFDAFASDLAPIGCAAEGAIVRIPKQ